MDLTEIQGRTSALMPSLLDQLEQLVAIPSVAFPGYPAEPVHQMAATTLELFRAVGFADARLMEVPTGYPPIYAELPGPAGSPTVLLYAHYDVQPAPEDQGWTSDPWVATRKEDGRVYGRGAADDKGGLACHLGTMQVFDGRPPCTVKLVLEGMEETESNLEAFVVAHPELFQCDVFVVCDMGNLAAGEPVLTTALRGDVACVVTVRTLEHPLHSGVFGGPAPDAMMALARLLATLHDDQGDVAVAGVSTGEWTGADLSAEDFEASADLVDGVRLSGTGPVGSRLWSRPSVSAIGIDMTSIAGSSNVLVPEASAKLSMRIVPGSDPVQELDALVHHLETHAPYGAQVEVRRTKEAPPFRCATDGPGYDAARAALAEAYGAPAGEAGSGGSIPLLRTLQETCPGAEFVLWGPEDVAKSRIHASDESVDPDEIERMVVAQARLLVHLAERAAAR
ncbi:M20/M25/M40 family metallo-hydrolase [Nocardioides mangrovi]|uniref:M20/M25/M40 family metallo-hydrolase n=1 Tax=Nocardioides mangrovi TaxID=2874580 RepID=A0ABS7U882_9ACTN|nr:M20/M25/M40 family metallo-hydrolase [Nocardioides mangrovi]MBZ5737100.1 M20/M25/M40 family metallo-hydrolase [Nocardioides mangrovi]